MNISLVTETFPPEINGVAMTLNQVVEGLVERGHRVTVLRPRQSKQDIGRSSPGLTHELFPGMSIPGYPLLKLGLPAPRRLRRLWTQLRPDLVHIATEGPLGYSALWVARKLRIPVTSTFHTNFHSYSRHYGFPFLTRCALAYLRHFHNRTRVTLSPSTDLNEQLTRDGFENVRLFARGVNTRVFSPEHRDQDLRKRFVAGPHDLLILHVSRLAAEKNYELLLRTFHVLHRENRGIGFVIASDGPLRRRLETQAPYAHFTGFLTREDLAALYASADLFLYPSLTETFGNVVPEAMASGLPVVAFDYAAAARLIKHGVNGCLAPFGDETAFMECSLQLSRSPEGRRTMGANAREATYALKWETVIDGLEHDLTETARLAGSIPVVESSVHP